MTDTWSPPELEHINAAGELQIAVRRTDGTLRRWTPIWVVCVDGQVYVRTWHRRDTGWYGHALRSHRVRIRVPGPEADAAVEDIGDGTAGAARKRRHRLPRQVQEVGQLVDGGS